MIRMAKQTDLRAEKSVRKTGMLEKADNGGVKWQE